MTDEEEVAAAQVVIQFLDEPTVKSVFARVSDDAVNRLVDARGVEDVMAAHAFANAVVVFKNEFQQVMESGKLALARIAAREKRSA